MTNSEPIVIDVEEVHSRGVDPTRGFPCWWSFKVRGVKPCRTLNVVVDRAPPPNTLAVSWSHPPRAAFSVDDGRTWLQTERGIDDSGRRTYAAQIDAAEAWFAWGPVFTSHFDAEARDRAFL